MSVDIRTSEYGSRIGNVEFVWAQNSREFVFSNTIVVHGKPSIVIDPSANFSYLEALSAQKKIDWVVNTHYHGDHRSLNLLFRGRPLYAHEADAPAISSYETYERFVDHDSESAYAKWWKDMFNHLGIVEERVTHTFKGGERVALAEGELEWVHLPGHTPGHTGILFPHISCLYISDIDLTPYGPWYANEVSDIDQFIASIEKIRNITVDSYVTSHGERIYTPEQFSEKLDRFAACFGERDQMILDKLKERPRSLNDLCFRGIIYRKQATAGDPLKAYFEKQMILKHLTRLMAKGEISRDEEKDLYLLN